MQIGIGLPNTMGVPGTMVGEWARRAEERGFAFLGTIDRVVYPTYDSLTALAVAAGATSRIGLLTDILLAPAYSPVLLAKATASLSAMSGGRFTLGVGVGGRPDDYAAVDRPFDRRGALMEETIDVLRRAWSGEAVAGSGLPVGPSPDGGRVPLLIGGTSEAAVRRTVEHGDGWTAGGGGPEATAGMVRRIRDAWRDGGRDGDPRMGSLTYFGLGSEEESRATLGSYYAFLGGYAQGIADGAARTPERARDTVAAFEEAGVTELAFMPTVGSLDEVDRLPDAVL